jgi:hypothetical protein
MISVEQSSNNQNRSYQIKANSKSSSNKNCRRQKRNNLTAVDIFKRAKFEFL